METIEVDTLHPDLTFTGDLLIDSSFILLPHSAPVTQELINALKLWGYEKILCDGAVSLGGDIGTFNSDSNTNEEETKGKIGDNVKKALENSKNTNFGNSDQARMEMVEGVYNEYMNYIEEVFTYYTTHKEIDQDSLSDNVRALCGFIKDHRRFILRVNPTTEATHKNFLVIHSMRTTVLALAIAMHMHMPLSKIVDLGVTTILHEIGMLRIPPQLYMSDRKLSNIERSQITKHTLLGYQILKDLKFPTQVCFDVLNHHENEIGTGYPRKLVRGDISTNAKIIYTACSYEAISSQRSYKDERSTFEALVELLQNKDKKYDVTVINALLYTVGFYPIGSFVFLSNSKVALVIDTNPDNPKCPIVQLLTERDKDGNLKIISTDEDSITVSRIMTKSEKNDIVKLFEEKEAKEKEMAKNNSSKVSEKAKTDSLPAKEEKVNTKSVKANTNSEDTEEVDINKFLG
ncbi:MAG: HD domain-containing protein [Treponema sp.]|nr:HD domain-containing protein [Treponema sp.]